MNMRKNKERQLIDGLVLIANLKDELEDYHYFYKQIRMIIVSENVDNMANIIANKNEDLGFLANYVYRLKVENLKLKEELTKLKEVKK